MTGDAIDEALGLPKLGDKEMPSREELDAGNSHVTRLVSRFLVATGKGPIWCVLMSVLDEEPEFDLSKVSYESFVEMLFHDADFGYLLVEKRDIGRPCGWLADEPPGVYEVEVVFRVTEAHWAGAHRVDPDVEVLEVDYEPRWRWGG